jgi:Tfp pilus assembly protein PilF
MPATDPLQEARAAMTARDFERVIQLTTEVLTNDLMNNEARLLSDQAREKMEAAPFIDQFVRKCEQSIKSGNLAGARADLEKARGLDPTHPGVVRVSQLIATKEASAPPAAASSFVVDSPAAPSTRGTAQASDFGFTFEEDKSAQQQQGGGFGSFSFDTPAEQSSGISGFSFDSPAAGAPPAAAPPPATPAFSFDSPAPSAAGREFDFSTASIETSPDDQKKIDQYLADGDKEFAAGNYQQAIDLWSRIFLIDVTNDAASERIEKAKGKRREIEQRLDGIIATGVQAFERKDFNTARTQFNEVLAADPGNVTAQDYLARMDQGAPAPEVEEASTYESVLEDDSVSGTFGESVEPEAAPIPSPTTRKPTAKAAAAARKGAPKTAMIAIAAVVVLAAAGWFGWSKFVSKPAVDPVATQGIIHRAGVLGQEGKFDEAIAMLRDIKPTDTQYDAALSLIADLQQKKARAATMVEGKPATAFYDENLAAGRSAFLSHDYVAAKRAFENAMRVKPLPPDMKAAYDTAAQQVGKLDAARQMFVERKYQDVINSLQPALLQDPQNKNIQRMILDAHFNLGAQALQQEDLEAAKREFDAVLKADPTDELARRSRDLAERYEGQPKDLLYRIYVKYLPLRQPAA